MPLSADTLDLIRRIHAVPQRAVLAVTGGGSLGLSELLCVPGASQTVLEAVVPYAPEALVEFLGGTPEQFCSAATARAMAMAAYRKAERLRDAELASRERERPESSDVADLSPSAPLPQGEKGEPRWKRWPVVGIGLTASLASDRPKRGPHRIHLAAQSASCTWSQTLELTKEARSRKEEEAVAAALLIDLLGEACGIAERPAVELLPEEKLERRRTEAPDDWRDLMVGRAQMVQADYKQFRRLPAVGIFPGSFNPLHDGHRRMKELAEQKLGGPIDYEISIENVGKLPLDYEDMQTRAAQYDDAPLYFTRAPRMVQKARLFPGRTIICGLDTLVRVADPKFADGSEAQRDQTVAEIAKLGCRFLVFGRATPQGFQTLDDLDIPPALRAISTSVPEAEFRADVSSTELRKRMD